MEMCRMNGRKTKKHFLVETGVFNECEVCVKNPPKLWFTELHRMFHSTCVILFPVILSSLLQ